MSVDVDSGDIIKVILQFCKENGLHKTFSALQEETNVTFNSVENFDAFVNDIQQGNWDKVLSSMADLKIPISKSYDLYEQILLELLELRETDTAKMLYRSQQSPFNLMREEQPERTMRLEKMLQKSTFDAEEAYRGSSKEKKRAAIAEALAAEISTVPASRLNALINQALKWQQHQGHLPLGTKFDLFRAVASAPKLESESFPTVVDKTIKFGSKSHAKCAKFSPSGQYLVTGSVDGFVEVWNYQTGKIMRDLAYQANDEFMMHDEAVLCISFSSDSEQLASASQDGKIKVWQVSSGKCVRRFDAAHSQGITSISFSKDNSQLLTASFDQTARFEKVSPLLIESRIHGMKSGKTLRIFRGHTSFVNDAIFAQEGSRVMSVSSDATIKVWDAKTTDCLMTFSLNIPPSLQSLASAVMRNPQQAKEAAIQSIVMNPKNAEQFFVCNRSPFIYLMNLKGQVLKIFCAEKLAVSDFLCFVVSPQGDYIHAVNDKGSLISFNTTSGSAEHSIEKVHEREVIGMAQHPHINLITTYADDGLVKLWKS